ncbi:MAG TPA: riboflavin kinase [Candidatus Saccharimonadales bacterium]|nr:riboflavin kinase [Candidatus Saccharimonadales bacterium]
MKPKTITGTITRFQANGRNLGYPTANLKVNTNLGDGVYFGFADLNHWKHHPALIFIGRPTTLGDKAHRVEAYLIDIPDVDYYDLPLILSINYFHRSNQTFKSIDELIQVMHEDELAARQWFKITISNNDNARL